MNQDHAVIVMMQLLANQQAQIDALKVGITKLGVPPDALKAVIQERTEIPRIKRHTAMFARAFQKGVQSLEQIHPDEDLDTLIDRLQWPLDLGGDSTTEES